MKSNKLLIFVILMLLSFVLMSCSKKIDNDSNNSNDNPTTNTDTDDSEPLPDDGIDWDHEIVFP